MEKGNFETVFNRFKQQVRINYKPSQMWGKNNKSNGNNTVQGKAPIHKHG